VLGDDRRQAVPGRRRGSALATGRACRGLWSGSRVAVSKASVVQCLVAIDRQAVPGRRRGSALATGRACRGLVRISGCGQRGERRAVLGDDRRQAVPGRRRGSALAADRACRGLVRVSGCGQAAVAAGVVSVGQCSVAIGWQAVPGRRRGSALAASRACRGLVRVSGCGPWCSVTGSSSGSSFSRLMKPAERRRRRQRRAVLGDDRRQAVPGRRRGSALAAGRACCGLVRISGCGQAAVAAGVVSVGQCSVAIGWQAVPGRRRGSALAAGRAFCGLVRVSGCWPWCSVTGSSSGSSFSRLVKPAERRRRRQCRAVLGGDRPASGARSNARQRTPKYRKIWYFKCARSNARQRTGSRSGLPWSGQDLGLRAGSGCRWRGQCRAVLGDDRRQAVPGRRRGSALAADRACCGLVRISGCGQAAVAAGVVSVGQCSVAIGWQAVPGRRRGSALAASRACRGLVRVSGCWPWCSVTGSSSGSSFSRLVKPAERRRRRQRRAVLGDDRRQAVPGRRRGSALATGRACRGLVRISGCGQQGERRAVLGSDRPASGAMSNARQRTGGRPGLLWSAGQALGLRAARRASCSAR
jgi:hypothetical protein